jgi:hypothetical protein
MVLLKSMDEEEFLLINAHKLKPYIVREEEHGEKPTIQEDTMGHDYPINLTTHLVEDHFIGVVLVNYFMPPSAHQPNRLLFNQKFVRLYPSAERFLLQGELGEVTTKMTYCNNQGPSLQATSHFPNLDWEERLDGVNDVKILIKPTYLPFFPPRFYQLVVEKDNTSWGHHVNPTPRCCGLVAYPHKKKWELNQARGDFRVWNELLWGNVGAWCN